MLRESFERRVDRTKGTRVRNKVGQPAFFLARRRRSVRLLVFVGIAPDDVIKVLRDLFARLRPRCIKACFCSSPSVRVTRVIVEAAVFNTRLPTVPRE